MNAPFYRYALFGEEVSFVVAFLIGIGFGFFLERAGFGSARKLTSQFYLNDLSVFKVMFTAIVTAGLGLFYLGWFGLLDLSLVYVSETFLLPQVIGGLLLGFGFVLGGYCPGTSLVAIATGKLDAMVYALGIFAGIFAFGEVFAAVESFYTATPMGAITLPELFHLPYGVVLLAVVLMAVGGFAGATWVERWSARRSVAQAGGAASEN
jgi:uncharacterized membrane protein YedE/YeeE